MKKLSILLIILLFFSSCFNTRYVSKNNEIPLYVVEEFKLQPSEYKIQAYDYLYISINSTNEDINSLYQRISSTYSSTSTGNEASFFLTGYLVNDEGNVFIPTIGEVQVRGLTISEARKTIEDKIGLLLTDAVINVRLTSFTVTFLGEVGQKGRIPFYRERVNIIEGFGSAGDINYYGDKKHVKILRQNDTTVLVYELDLTNKNILNQKEFYLHPNDIVYVPPKRSKDFYDIARDYSSIVTIVTSTFTSVLLILQLTKNGNNQ